MDLQILGIDAAVDPRNTGLAIARHAEGRWRLDYAAVGQRKSPLGEQICAELDPTMPVLLAIDAPLGWPTELTSALADHRAGEPLRADHLFNRETDRFVREQTGLKPLDIGAERIARTAVAALELVADLRSLLGQPLPLLESNANSASGGLIEAYPAATLKQHGQPHRGYKRTESKALREEIADYLSQSIDLQKYSAEIAASDHVLDAVLCTLTAMDFLGSLCSSPTPAGGWSDEGWIWFRSS